MLVKSWNCGLRVVPLLLLSNALSRKMQSCPRELPTQRAQYPLVKESTLTHNIKAPIILAIFLI